MARGAVEDARNQGSDALLPPPPLTGANVQLVFTQQNKPQLQEGIHQVVQGNNNYVPPSHRKAGMFIMIRMYAAWSS
jgi:hypothetical protein